MHFSGGENDIHGGMDSGYANMSFNKKSRGYSAATPDELFSIILVQCPILVDYETGHFILAVILTDRIPHTHINH